MGLYVKNLTKTFGSKVAVDHLSFQMEESGVFGLIGTNGAGKTTTIRMILGIMQADEGKALWNDTPINRDSLSFGYMPEERGIYMKNKVLEQLVYFGRLRGMNRSDAQKSALRYLQRLGMENEKNTLVEKLSKGNQQKIQLISTLIHDPKLIFLDEPFSGLDPVNTEVLRGLLQELIDEKRYIVMSSHQMSTVEEYCKDILILHQGQTKLCGNLREIKRGYGHTNLLISCDVNIDETAKQYGLEVIEKRANETEYRIHGDEMAHSLLSHMLSQGFYPTKFEIREPSLNEIFIEKVGAEV